jgi:hypothetical protein
LIANGAKPARDCFISGKVGDKASARAGSAQGLLAESTLKMHDSHFTIVSNNTKTALHCQDKSANPVNYD